MSTTVSTDPRTEARTRLEHVTDELGELLADQHVWRSTERIALANPRLRANPFFVSWIGTAYYRRAAAAVRAMVDPNGQADSIVTVLTFIKQNAADIAPTNAVPALLDANGRFDPVEVDKDILKLRTAAADVRRYVNQHLAHLDRTPTAPVPTSSEIDAIIAALEETAHRYHLALTGIDLEIEPKFLFDWSEALTFAWIEPSA